MNAFTKHVLKGIEDYKLNGICEKFENVNAAMYEFEDTFDGDSYSLWNETELELGEFLC